MDTPSNEKERQALALMRDACKDLEQDDLTLLRFLRAREGDATKAEDMLRKSIQWRRDNDVASFMTWVPPNEVEKDFRYNYIGEDNEGYAVIHCPIGKWHIRDTIEQGFKEEAFLFRFSILENIINCVNKTKQYQFVIVFDLSELTYRKVAHTPTIQLLVSAFRDFEANYPERLKAAYVINAPWVFPYIYSFIKPLLSGRTLSKVQIYDANVSQWKSALLQRIPEENLPQEYVK